MKDLDIIKILGKRSSYNRYMKYIQPHNVTTEAKTILADMEKWFEEDKTREEIDWNSFSTWFTHGAHPSMRADKALVYNKLLDRIISHTVDPTLEKSLIESFIGRDYGTRMAGVALRVAEGDSKADIEEIGDLLGGYHRELGKTAEIDSYLVSEDLDEILSSTIGGTGLDWRLPALNQALGPLRKGNFVIVGARPDSGKTTLLASEATFMASQLAPDEHVLWINNEEAGASVRSRIIQAGIGWTIPSMDKDKTGAWAKYCSEVGEGKIKLSDKADISVKEIGELLEKFNVKLLIFDQLWKIKGFEKEAGLETQRLTMLFSQAREWAKEYCPVITVHQADGSAENEKYITMNQLYQSKTGIQGEADAIVTIGRTTQLGYEQSRFIYVPKNKLPGGPLSDPALRNGKFEIQILPEIARFK